MLKHLHWFEDHILEVISIVLLGFIPLYPKLPLIDILPGYIVRVRIEDFLVLFAAVVYLFEVLRRKIKLTDNPLFYPILIYAFFAFLSTLSAIFITKTVPLSWLHVVKLYLHFLRRFEYFALFFVLFSSIKSSSQVKRYIYWIGLVVALVTVYGYGQKYLYWPAFSTMNREFAKGWILYLSEHARVLSTFGGHYDLAAYLMMVLTLLVSLFLTLKSKLSKIFFLVIYLGAFWLMILTVSRTSFLAYLASVTTAIFLLSFKKGKLWALSRWVIVMAFSFFIMVSFGDLSDRFAHLLKLNNLKSKIGIDLTKPFGRSPPSFPGSQFLVNNLETVSPRSDTPPTVGQVPSDVVANVSAKVIEVKNASGEATFIARPRTYSENALVYDLSSAIRFDATWPRAIKGFKTNPLLGTGYSTLTKTSVAEFTEAESTDNDYLRALGETGLFGFLAFYGVLAVIVYKVAKTLKKIEDPLLVSTVAGLSGALAGLLVNAVYIDVFESSKIAMSFWAFNGILMAVLIYAEKGHFLGEGSNS